MVMVGQMNAHVRDFANVGRETQVDDRRFEVERHLRLVIEVQIGLKGFDREFERFNVECAGRAERGLT